MHFYPDNDCSEMELTTGIETPSNNSVQLRIVQPEHGGGSCNCWGVKELAIRYNSNDTVELQNSDV